MIQTTHYDAILIGAGQAGTPLSTTLARAGWKTAIIERVHVGGTCINEGCTPTKTMVASGRVAYLARRGADYGVQTGPVTIDMTKVRQRKRDIVESFRNSGQRRIETTDGVDLLMGEASFTGPKTLELRLNNGETRELTADTILINAGARPAKPSMLIVGGGYIGLEFGQLFRRFGSQVTVIQRGAGLLAREDPDVAEEVANIMREDGLEILLETKPVSVKQLSAGNIQLTVQTKTGERTLNGSHLLMAAGRVPNTDWLNLDAAGIQTDKRGFIQVNDRLETNVPGIYALGDIKGGPAFTHISYDDFRIIRTNLLEKGNATIHDRLVPYTVFIDPQLGRIGLSETDARTQGRNFKIARMPMNYVARALEMGESRGFMKAVVDADTGQILGAAVLGIEGGEIMAILEVAMIGKVPYDILRDGVFAHPTLAESLNNLFSTFDQ